MHLKTYMPTSAYKKPPTCQPSSTYNTYLQLVNATNVNLQRKSIVKNVFIYILYIEFLRKILIGSYLVKKKTKTKTENHLPRFKSIDNQGTLYKNLIEMKI